MALENLAAESYGTHSLIALPHHKLGCQKMSQQFFPTKGWKINHFSTLFFSRVTSASKWATRSSNCSGICKKPHLNSDISFDRRLLLYILHFLSSVNQHLKLLIP